MDKKTRELLAKLYTSQLEQLAKEKEIDCGEDPDRIDYLTILGKSDLISKKDIKRFIDEMEAETKDEEKEDEYLAEVENILKKFKNQGPIFEKAHDLLKKMQSNFSSGNLEGTITIGYEGSGLIVDMTDTFERIRRAFVIYAFRQLISDLKESGIDIGEAEMLTNRAAEFLHHEENEELDGIIQQITNKAEELQKEQAKRLKELISDVDEFIDQARDLGADINEAKKLLRKAEDAFDSKIFKKVSDFATKARKSAEEARRDRIQGISDSLLFVRTILTDAKEIGADVAEPEEIYSQAKTAFDGEDYSECKSLIKEAEQLALQLQDDQIQKALKLRKRREPEEGAVADVGKDVVEVEAEIVSPPVAPPQERYSRDYPSRYPQSYQRPPIVQPRIPRQNMRKTRCPNCGQGFPVRAGKGPIRIECPFCGMRGMMP
ncbi:MAG: hypothetical protein JSV09_16705 [Thermoplasmata archaeon]|nr:MAG: hypothetical protein JSV09_16705 [Thermoplasmata archaeon]